jgi:hypothetical protein
MELVNDEATRYFEENVRDHHGISADGEPCPAAAETPLVVDIDARGVFTIDVRCTCGYAQFEAELREFHPGLFREDFE